MPPPEQSSSSPERRPAVGKRQPLCIRLYFQDHLTEIVRSLGYGDTPATQARERMRPLIDQFGRQKILDGVEELLEFDDRVEPPVTRLKAEVVKLAFQLLGPQPKVPATRRNDSSGSAESRAIRSRTESTGPRVNMPRYHVMAKFEEHLATKKVTFVTGEQLRRGHPSLRMLPAIDYLVHRGALRLIVAVRPSLRDNQAAQLIAYQDALLANHAAVRVWPTESATGWNWQEHELLAGPLNMDANRYKLSLDDWRSVHEHANGDKKCGREWFSEGCACAACRAARSVLTPPPAKGSKRAR